MIGNAASARKSTESIERIYITMRHLFYRGSFKVTGTSGMALRELLLKLNPEIYGSIAEPNRVELEGLLYVLDRLPQGIEECSYINLTSDEGYQNSSFQPIVPLKRRRNCYRIDEEQMNIEVTRGRSEIYDILTHLTFFYNEADKIRNNAFGSNPKKMNRTWQKLEEFVYSEEEMPEADIEVVLTYLAQILGRTFEETKWAYEAFSYHENKHRLLHVVYWMGKLSYQDFNGLLSREILFTSTLISTIGHHITGEKWANHIKKTLVEHQLQNRPLHIISSNMHSVMNMLYAHQSLKGEYLPNLEFQTYEELSVPRNKDLRDHVMNFAQQNGLLYIKDKSGANINVQIIDLEKYQCEKGPFKNVNSNDVLLVMDYAFGEQAFEVMDELLKPYKNLENGFTMQVKSISIMGKAGILEGRKGDIMIPTSHIFEGTADNYPFKNELQLQDFQYEDLKSFSGMMVTVLGTSLQNKDLLHFFRDTSWEGIGLEMEGAHYQKAIQIASKIRAHIAEDVKVRYAYYASDNPLETGGTLASGGLGLTGVKPTYLITSKILEQILKK